MCKAGLSKSKAKAVFAFAEYAVGPGQKVAPSLSYAPLPAAVDQKAKAKVAALQCNGSALQGAA